MRLRVAASPVLSAALSVLASHRELMARDLPTGIVKTATGFRTFVWLPDPRYPKGRIASKRWKADATITAMRQWREDQRVAARKQQPAKTTLTGFTADAAAYLASVQAMPSYSDRARDIGEWIARFAEHNSLDIQPHEIRAARDAWLTSGPKRVQVKQHGKIVWTAVAEPLAASTVNHRLRALENFFTVMYPKAPNPVREVPEAQEPAPEPRGLSFAIALEVLSFMPDVTTPKKGELPEPGSLSRARFAAMLWTGLPAVQLARLTPERINWTQRTMVVPHRQKGRSSRRSRSRVAPAPRPLLPQALDALKRLFALHGNRTFSSSSLEKSVKRAVAAANRARAERHQPPLPTHVTVYTLTRHTFGTEAMRMSGNLKAVQNLMGHRDITQTERYAAAAVNEHTTQAIVDMQRALTPRRRGGKVTGKVSPGKSARGVRTRRKDMQRNA